jgi:hypothetical protein
MIDEHVAGSSFIRDRIDLSVTESNYVKTVTQNHAIIGTTD